MALIPFDDRDGSIWFDGEIVPCPYMDLSIGNVTKEPLKVILDRGMKILNQNLEKVKSILTNLMGLNKIFLKVIKIKNFPLKENKKTDYLRLSKLK